MSQPPAMVQRACKYRFYPTRPQQALLSQFFGAARCVWDKALDWQSQGHWHSGESLTGADFSRELTQLKRLQQSMARQQQCSDRAKRTKAQIGRLQVGISTTTN